MKSINLTEKKALFLNESIIYSHKNGKFYAKYGSSLGIWGEFYNKHNIDCTWVCRNGGVLESDKGYIEVNHKKFILLPNYSKNFFKNTILAFLKLNKIFRSFDSILISMPGFFPIVGIMILNFKKIKHVINLVGDPWTAYKSKGLFGPFLALLFTFFTKILIFRSKIVIYVSRNFLQNKYPTTGQKFYIPDVIIDDYVDTSILNRRLVRIAKLSSEINIGLIGSLDVNYRGHRTLIKALNVISSKSDQIFKVKFLGPGDFGRWANFSKKLGLEKSILHDGVLPPGKNILDWLDNIDILVMPTRQETMGRSIIESMNRGCLVLGSSNTAIHEQISNENLFYSEDFNTLSKLILKVSKNKDFLTFSAYENFYRSYKYSYSQIENVIIELWNFYYE